MALEVVNLTRKFKLEGTIIDDPNPSFSVQEVRDFLSVKYPELTTAIIKGPEISGDVAEYEFTTKLGTKG